MGVLKRILWLVVVGSVVLALFRGFPLSNPGATWSWLQTQGQQLKQIADQVTGKVPDLKVTNPIHLPTVHKTSQTNG